MIDMKIGDEEYLKLRDAFMKEEFDKNPQKPNGMFGTQGWYIKKEREFREKLEKEGKIE